MASPEPRFLAGRWMILGEWRAHPARVATAALAIAIGVALGFAVHLVNASAKSEFARAIGAVGGDADLSIRALSRRGFDEQLYPPLARLPDVEAASPVVEIAVRGADADLRILGLDALRAVEVTPNLVGRAGSAGLAEAPAGETMLSDRAVFLSPAALAGRRVGERLHLQGPGGEVDVVIAGVLPGAAEGQRLGVMDIAAVQWRLGGLGRLHRIDLKLAPGADLNRLRNQIAAILPADAEVATPQTQARRNDALSRAYRVNLDMLALVALLTGAFLVYSAQSLSVARRRPQFALLRVLGARRRLVLGQVMTEGLIVGGAGAALGLGVGLLLASSALRFLGGDLGGAYFQGGQPRLIFAPGAAALFFGLGLAAALLGSILPAREAARTAPAAALKAVGDAVDPTTRPRARWALGLLAAGGLCAFLPAVAGLPIFGYLSIALLLAGGVAAMPWVARVLISPLQRLRLRSPALDLAVQRLWGAPSQAAVALCGIVASTALMVAMAIMVTSFRGSVDDWLVQILPADLYFRLDPAAGGLDPTAQQRLAAVPGVRAITFQSQHPARLAEDRPAVTLVVGPADRMTWTARRLGIGRTLAAPPGAIAVRVSEPAARIYRLEPGDRFMLPVGGARTEVFVTGVYRDYARQTGAVVIDEADYVRLTGDRLRHEAAVELESGATTETVGRALAAALPDGLAERAEIIPANRLRVLALQIFDRSFRITYVLEAVAIVVGLAGVAATISAQTLARTREFGMLRHVGVLRGQITAMLAAEGALLGLVGGVAGLTLGLAMSQVLIHVVNPQSFNWTMQTRLPWALLAGVAVGLIAAAAGTALAAGRRATSAAAVQAVREDW